jgi:hypothetical protein
MVAALILSPLTGAIIDKSGSKKLWLGISVGICAIGTAGLFFAGPGNVWLAVWLVVIGNTGFMLSEAFCASFLPEIATPENMGKVSGLGWGIGYLGGLVSVVIATQIVIRADPSTDLARYVAENQWAMVAMAGFFLLASLPTFLLVRNRSVPAPGFEHASMGQLLRAGVSEFLGSLRTAREYRVLFQFLVAFMVYMAGLDAIVIRCASVWSVRTRSPGRTSVPASKRAGWRTPLVCSSNSCASPTRRRKPKSAISRFRSSGTSRCHRGRWAISTAASTCSSALRWHRRRASSCRRSKRWPAACRAC